MQGHYSVRYFEVATALYLTKLTHPSHLTFSPCCKC